MRTNFIDSFFTLLIVIKTLIHYNCKTLLIFVELSYKQKKKVMKIKDNLCLSEEESQIFDMTVFQDNGRIVSENGCL